MATQTRRSYARPHQAQAEQLELPCTVSEAAQLREQLTVLQGRCARWEDFAHQLEKETHALRAERDAFKREVDALTFQVKAQQFLIERAGDRARAGTAVLPAWLDGALKELLLVAHPDRAAQWQDAASLGHELSVVVNTLRQRLEAHR